MTSITVFTCNPFSENGYIISNEQKDCWIIDPGCYNEKERTALQNYIEKKALRPLKLLNTHCHLDHIYGNAFVAKTYELSPEFHELEIPVMNNASVGASIFGVPAPEYTEPGPFIKEGEVLNLGQHAFKILFTPGHSPGSICFYNEEEQYVIAGDVLFQGSIGRTDLPGGDYDTLIHSIRTQLLTLPDVVKVYNGHGAYTTIGDERRSNPFLR